MRHQSFRRQNMRLMMFALLVDISSQIIAAFGITFDFAAFYQTVDHRRGFHLTCQK